MKANCVACYQRYTADVSAKSAASCTKYEENFKKNVIHTIPGLITINNLLVTYFREFRAFESTNFFHEKCLVFF